MSLLLRVLNHGRLTTPPNSVMKQFEDIFDGSILKCEGTHAHAVPPDDVCTFRLSQPLDGDEGSARKASGD